MRVRSGRQRQRLRNSLEIRNGKRLRKAKIQRSERQMQIEVTERQ